MIAALFHDEYFRRDASGTYYSTAVPYAVLARYLAHFERVVVVGRLGEPDARSRTVASGAGLEWNCIAGSPSSPVRYLTAISARAREVLANVDCAIVHMPGIVGPMACRAAIGTGTPWMVEVVGDAFDSLWNHGSLRGKASAVPLHLLNRHFIGRARFAVYVTASTVRRYPPGGAWIAASDVVIEAPRPEVLERRLAGIDSRPEGSTAALGLVGSYDVNYKGHETALRGLQLLHHAGRRVELRCIGVGDPTRWRARAAELGVERCVCFGGAIPHGPAVLEWMDALDVCVAPSLTEGLPRALVEAMSRALPAVASRTGGIPELLDGRCLHRPGDHRAFASLVGALLDTREELKAQARRNWQASSRYAVDVIAARRDRFMRDFKAAVVAHVRGADRARHRIGRPRTL